MKVLPTKTVGNLDSWLASYELVPNWTYRVLFSVRGAAETHCDVASLLDTSAQPNTVSSLLLLPWWQAHVKPAKDPCIKTAERQEAFYVIVILVQCTRIGHLHARARIQIIKNLTVDLLLGPYLVRRCKGGTFYLNITQCQYTTA